MCSLVCVCVCVKRGCARPCNVNVEKEMTCRRVNKINNIRLFSLFNKRTRYRVGSIGNVTKH